MISVIIGKSLYNRNGGEDMLILGSNGFYSTENRLKISEMIKDKTGNMLIIPLACMFEEETGEKEKNCAEMAGFKKENIYVFRRDLQKELMSRKYDYIVVLGGNTFKLLYYVKKYQLDSFIKQQVAEGTVYLGFSAGAYIACENIRYVRHFDDNNHITDENFDALGLTEKYVLCHFDSRGITEIKMCREDIGFEPELITIRETELIVI